MLMPMELLKTGWGWEALTVFLVNLFSLTRRYDIISILFPDAPSKGGRMIWGSEALEQTDSSLPGYNFSYFVSN